MRRTIGALSALVLVLAVAVLLDRPAPRVATGAADRALPGLAPDRIAALRLAPSTGPAYELAPSSDGLALVAPTRWPTDAAAVADLVGALQLLAARRRVDDDPARRTERGVDRPRVTVVVTDVDRVETELAIGPVDERLAGAWVRRRGPAGTDVLLVDAWAARALDRPATDLRRRDPFRAGGEGAARIVVRAGEGALVLRGRPPCVELPGGCARADGARVDALRETLAELRLVRFVDTPPGSPPTLVLEVDGERLALHGACPGAPDERLVATTIGDGCVAAGALAALPVADRDPRAWVERRLLGADPSTVDRLEVRPARGEPVLLGRGRAGWALGGTAVGTPVDEDGVGDALADLATVRATAVTSAAPRATRPADATELLVERDARVERVWLWPAARGGEMRGARPGEPIELAFPAAAARAVALRPLALRDRTVFAFDPWGLAEIETREGGVREVAVRRATADDWRLTEPVRLPADRRVVATLRDVAATLRASRVIAASAAPPHGLAPPRRVVTLVVDPPPGAAAGAGRTRHELALGAPTPDGECHARRAGDPVVVLLRPAACAAFAARLATRDVTGIAPDEVRAAELGGVRHERAGGSWLVDGERLAPRRAAALAAVVRLLGVAEAVEGYGPPPRGAPVVLETGRETIRLVIAGRTVAREGRPVRYRIPAEACARWPGLCVPAGPR